MTLQNDFRLWKASILHSVWSEQAHCFPWPLSIILKASSILCILQSNDVFLSNSNVLCWSAPIWLVNRWRVSWNFWFVPISAPAKDCNPSNADECSAHVSSVRMKPCRNAIFNFVSSSLNLFTSATIWPVFSCCPSIAPWRLGSLKQLETVNQEQGGQQTMQNWKEKFHPVMVDIEKRLIALEARPVETSNVSFTEENPTTLTTLIERVQVLELRVNNLEPSNSTLHSSISSTPLEPRRIIKGKRVRLMNLRLHLPKKGPQYL